MSSGAYRHHRTRLANGLQVHVLEMPHLHTASVGFFAKVGSRHEPRPLNGVSHFLEHMLFRGCDGWESSRALNGAFEDLGGNLDGFTSRDFTGYQTSLDPAGLEEGLDLLGRMMSRPLLDGITTERAVVREEMLEALDERGRSVELDAVAHRHHFGDHALGQPIEGRRGNLRRFGRSALSAHLRKFYVGHNATLAIAGRIDKARALRQAKRSFAELPAGRRHTEGPRPPATQGGFRFVHYRGPQTRVRFSFRAASERHRDHAALVWLRRWFDGGLSARLQVELVDRLGLAYEVGASVDSYSDVGLFDFEVVVANANLPRAVEALGTLIADARGSKPSQAEVDRIGTRARRSFDGMLDAPPELVHWYGVGGLFDTAQPPEERLQRVLALTPDAIGRAARRTFRTTNLTVTAVGGADAKTVAATRAAARRLPLP